MEAALDRTLREGIEAFLSRQCSQPIETPEGLIVRCRSRLKERCPSCSTINVGDWQAIIRSGVFGAPVGSRFFLLTLTAPSFGKVHRVAKEGRRAQPCGCGAWHDPNRDGQLRGLPLDQDEYDYMGQVDWNAATGRLWDATRARLRAALPSMAFATVREWQARGALHLHVLIRVDAADGVGLDIVARGKERHVSLIEDEARAVMSHTDAGIVARWGENVDCRPIRADESTGRAIWYLTKAIGYLTKEVADGGGGVSPAGLRHWSLLSAAARDYRCVRCRLYGGFCGALLHRQWGARSHVVSVSRKSRDGKRAGWSLTGLTRAGQRAARLAWALENYADSAEDRVKDSQDRHRYVRKLRRMFEEGQQGGADPP